MFVLGGMACLGIFIFTWKGFASQYSSMGIMYFTCIFNIRINHSIEVNITKSPCILGVYIGISEGSPVGCCSRRSRKRCLFPSSRSTREVRCCWWICWRIGRPNLAKRNLEALPWRNFIFWMMVSNIFYFHPYLGKIPSLTNIFQMGWNHQLVILVKNLT